MLALTRGPEGDRPSVRPWLLGIARTWADSLAQTHAVGWAHADVQPTNTLVADGRAVLIDYALACGPGDRPRAPVPGSPGKRSRTGQHAATTMPWRCIPRARSSEG